MRRFVRMTVSLALSGGLALGAMGCGGGETAIVGFGNHDNRMSTGGLDEELVEALAEHPGTPEITDDVVAEIFAVILEHAREGDAESALIVLKVAEEQRETEED